MKNLFSRKTLFLLLLVIFFIPLMGYLYFFKMAVPTTVLNDTEKGNTSGNITNGGFTAIKGGWVYLSNFSDNNKLYKLKADGSSLTKISDDNCSWINVSGDWIFYYNDSEGAIYKIKTDGTGRKKICSDKASYVNLVGNNIYYSDESDGRIIYAINVNGRGKKRINDESSTFVNVSGDYIFYRNQSHKLLRINLDGSNKTVLDNGETNFINVSGNEIYYTLQDNRPKLYKIKTDGTDKTMITDFEAYNVLVDGDYIYFSNATYNGFIYKIKKDDDSIIRVSLEIPSKINISGNKIYYSSIEDKGKLYATDTDGIKRQEIGGNTVVYNYIELYDAIDNSMKFSIGDSKLDETYNKAKSIVKNIIKPDMTQLQREITLHDYLLSTTTYDTVAAEENSISTDSHLAFNVLVNGKGVCDGYSEAMKLLLDLSGIKSDVVVGNDEKTSDGIIGHEWNIVQIDGRYYQLDVTWDDYMEDNYGMMSYKYFNLSDNMMAKDHKWDKEDYEKCTSNKYDYFYNMDSAERDGEFIYYSNPSDKNKLYRVNLDGTQNKKISNDVIVFFKIRDGWIYYSNYSNGGYIYKMKIDGTEKRKLNSDWSIDLKIDGDWIQYENKSDNGKLYRIKIDGTQRHKI